MWRIRFIEASENVFYCVQEIRPYPASVVALVEPFQAAMFETPNHQDMS